MTNIEVSGAVDKLDFAPIAKILTIEKMQCINAFLTTQFWVPTGTVQAMAEAVIFVTYKQTEHPTLSLDVCVIEHGNPKTTGIISIAVFYTKDTAKEKIYQFPIGLDTTDDQIIDHLCKTLSVINP